ncbi:unnamed protein product [Bemisia tabaci]|uniref:rRNA methyltransferase 2, mitochondrial n=1 Tax=Bemisia tabaci TaxID=7038 RepID=A0A9P0F5I2_BEMTA|nr:unnamed protein product [Bemisia tabaci]
MTMVILNHSRTRFSSNLSAKCSQFLQRRWKNSAEWLNRQHSDPYVRRAKMENYRCRSAFKLLEMDERFKFLTPGKTVIDCGAAPGSWTQVAVTKVNANGKDSRAPKGKVLSIDRLPFYPVDGAIIFPLSDFTTKETQTAVKEALQNEKVDIVMSDIAPNVTGLKDVNHDLIIKLVYTVIRFALPVTKPGGICLVKLWDGNKTSAVETDLQRFYKKVRRVKPKASRSDSTEVYLLASDFLGIKT